MFKYFITDLQGNFITATHTREEALKVVKDRYDLTFTKVFVG